MPFTAMVGHRKISLLSPEVILSSKQFRELSQRGNIICHQCGEKMVYKHGKLVVPHFAHQKRSSCYRYAESDSIHHLRGIQHLARELSKKGISVEPEVWLGDQRPDLYLRENKVVIEVQCTPIPAAEIVERTRKYESKNLQRIWVFGYPFFDLPLNSRGFWVFGAGKRISRSITSLFDSFIVFSTSQEALYFVMTLPFFRYKIYRHFRSLQIRDYSRFAKNEFSDLMSLPDPAILCKKCGFPIFHANTRVRVRLQKLKFCIYHAKRCRECEEFIAPKYKLCYSCRFPSVCARCGRRIKAGSLCYTCTKLYDLAR